MPGPVPKRSDQRRRRNKEPDGIKTITAPGVAVVAPPPEDRTWCQQAKNWYRALKKSGQAQFYQASDWEEARICALLMSNELKREHGPRATMMDVIFSRADNLLTTEGARRRLRIELTAAQTDDDPEHEATVSIINEYKDVLAVSSPGGSRRRRGK